MWTRFEGRIESHSGKAILFEGNYWHGAVWLPRSQIRMYQDGSSYIVDVKDWLAEKNGLMEFTPYSEQQIEAINGKG